MSLGHEPLGEAGSQRILANTAYRASADVGSKLISVAFFVVLARQLGESGFGVFVFGLALAALLTVLASFGQDPVLTREVARDFSRLDAYFANTFALKLVLALPVLLVAGVVVTAGGMDFETRSVVLLLGVALVAEQLATTCFAVYQAYEQLVYVPVVILTQRALTTAVGVVALLAGADVVVVSAIYLGGALVALAVALLLLLRRVARPRLLVTPRTWRGLFAAAAPVGVAWVLGLLLFRVDTAILALFESDEIVGNYGAAFRLFEATLFIGWAVTSAVYPVLARLAPGSRSVSDVFDASLKLIVALTLPLAVGATILADPIIHLVYGTGFDEAVTPLALLAPAIVVYSLAHVAGATLVARNRQRAMAVTIGVVAALNVAANFLVIPLLSLDGAALVALATQVVLAVVLLGLARGVTGAITWRRILAGPLTAGALLALTTAVLRDNLGAAILCGAAVYVIVLAVVERVAYPEDARAIRNFVRGGHRSEAAAR